MFFLVYEAHPRPAHQAYGTIDGAFISLWVNENLEGPAQAVATSFINEQDWDIAQLTDCYPVSLEMYPPGNSSREHFLQALQDDVVATFYTWPIGAPEE